MWTISHMIMMSYLAILSAIDMRERKVPAAFLAIGMIAVILDKMILGQFPSRESVFLYGGGIAVGIIFLMVSLLTQEMFGYGDSCLIVILGLYLGLWDLLCMLTLAFLTCAMLSLFGLVTKKLSRKESLPFIPFLFIGTIGVMNL